MLERQKDFEKLWPPEGETLGFSVLIKPAKGKSILDKDTLTAAMDVYAEGTALTVTRKDGTEYGLISSCYRPSPL